MIKNASAQQINMLLKLAAFIGNPASDPALVKMAREQFEKNADFGDMLSGISDMGSSALSGIGDMASNIGSSMSGLASNVMSNLQLPFGVTLQSIADKLCSSDMEMAQMKNTPGFMDALSQALAGMSKDDIEAIG